MDKNQAIEVVTKRANAIPMRGGACSNSKVIWHSSHNHVMFYVSAIVLKLPEELHNRMPDEWIKSAVDYIDSQDDDKEFVEAVNTLAQSAVLIQAQFGWDWTVTLSTQLDMLAKLGIGAELLDFLENTDAVITASIGNDID